MKFFYLFVFVYVSNAIPLALKDDIPAEKTNTIQSPDLLASLKSNPKQFVADMQNLDPTALARVITLLEDLKASSEAKETKLIDDLNVKNTALDQANARVVQKENDVDNANNDVGNANNALSAAEQAANDAITAAQGVLTSAQHAATAATTDLTNERTAQAALQAEKDASKTTHDDEIPTLNEEQRVLTEVINMLNGLPDAADDGFEWDAHASGTLLEEDGHLWKQNGACRWCGVKSKQSISSGKVSWKMIIVEGARHQIGVALADWSLDRTPINDPDSKFAFLFSQSNGMLRYNGAAKAFNFSSDTFWTSGSWDQFKGEEFTVTVDMDEKTFEVETEEQWLGQMKFPDSWTTVYPAAAGGSSDSIYRIL